MQKRKRAEHHRRERAEKARRQRLDAASHASEDTRKSESVHLKHEAHDHDYDLPKHNNGMIYLSRGFADTTTRVDPRSPTPSPTKQMQLATFDDADDPPAPAAEDAVVVKETVSDEINPAEEEMVRVRVKRKCSNALLNMSCNERMQSQFVEQGGLAALLELAVSCRDEEVVTNCAATLNNLIPYV